MYLSRLILNFADRNNLKLLNDIYKQHQFIMKGFKDNHKPESVLFRLEPEKASGINFIVQSSEEPVWDNKGYVSEIKPYEPNLESGAILQFRVRVNPVKRLARGNEKAGKLLGLQKEELVKDWLQLKSENKGFEIISGNYSNEMLLRGEKAGKQISIQSWLINGICKVTDVALFEGTLKFGIGRSTSMGFGLFSIARHI